MEKALNVKERKNTGQNKKNTMSDILKNQALKAIQGAMASNPIGSKIKKVKNAIENYNYENDDKGMRTNPTATEQPDPPKRNKKKSKKKSKKHTAQPRRAS